MLSSFSPAPGFSAPVPPRSHFLSGPECHKGGITARGAGLAVIREEIA
jgi:hypothetical protein